MSDTEFINNSIKLDIIKINKQFNFKSGEYDIILFVDNSKTNNKTIIKDTFKDYFYVKTKFATQLQNMFNDVRVDTDVEYKSIFAEPVYKCTYSNFKTPKNILSHAHKDYKYNTYEVDVSVEFKYLINHPNIKFKENNRHILFFDIETRYNEFNKRANSPEIALSEITSIQCYSTKTNEYYILAWHPNAKPEFITDVIVDEDTNKSSNIIYMVTNNEIHMLELFEDLFRELKPDVLSGWFSEWYDIPYIINRYNILKRNTSWLSSYAKSRYDFKSRKFYNFLSEIDNVDFKDAFFKMGYKLPDEKLNTAAKEILGDKYTKIKEYSFKDWEHNFEGFLKYGFRDVEILKKINEKLDNGSIFNYLYSMQNLSSCIKLNDTLKTTTPIDNFILKTYKDKYVFPNVHPVEKEHYLGAHVQHPAKYGIIKNVAIFDYKSLYPTIMATLNISTDTIICTQNNTTTEFFEKEIIDVLNKNKVNYIDTGYTDELVNKRILLRTHENKLGVIAETEYDLFFLRQKIKNKRDTYDKKSTNYQLYDLQQIAYKIFLNSIYGVLASRFYRLANVNCSDLITYIGRTAIKFTKTYFESRWPQLNVQYMDTDSCFVEFGEHYEALKDEVKYAINNDFNNELFEQIIKPMFKHVTAKAKKYFIMELEFEKLLKNVYFSNTKKRYYGITDYNDVYVKGMNIIRKDTPEFLKHELNNLAYKIVNEEIQYEDLDNVIQSVKNQNLLKIGVYKSFNKNLDEYKNEPQHVKAMRLANEQFGQSITENDIPLMFYIELFNDESSTWSSNENNTICLLENGFDVFKNYNNNIRIDYNTYIDKQLIQPLSEFDLIDNVNLIIHDYKLTQKEFYDKEYFNVAEKIKKYYLDNKIDKIISSKKLIAFIKEYYICFKNDVLKDIDLSKLNLSAKYGTGQLEELNYIIDNEIEIESMNYVD